MGDGGIPRGVAGVTSAQEHESALPPGAAHRFVSRLFGTRASVPEVEVIYAVGDIHGRQDLLGSLHAAIPQELAAADQARHAPVCYLVRPAPPRPRTHAGPDP